MPRSVEVTVTATARTGPGRAFGVIAPIDLARIFPGYGPIPAVAGVRDQTGPWDAVGRSRVALLADGGEVPERLTAYDPPAHFAYRLGPFPAPLGRLVAGADGAWWFSSRGQGTRIRWTYAFHPRRGTRPLVRIALAPLWRRYARRALALAVRAAETGAP